MSRRLVCVLLVVLGMGFEWPGRLQRLKYEIVRGELAARRDAVRRLADYPRQEVREPLLAALEDEADDVRRAAAWAVGRAKLREATPLLAAWLGAREPSLRLAALQALGELGDPAAGEALRRGLSDPLPELRRAAALALGPIADDEGLRALEQASADADPSVREAVIVTLQGKNDLRVVPVLAGRIKDESAPVRAAVLRALGSGRDPRAVPLVLQAAGAERDPEVSLAAVMALGELGANDARTAELVLAGLQRKLAGEPRLAQAALAAIGRIDGRPALTVLIDALANPELARSAQSSLGLRMRSQLGAAERQAARSQLAAAMSAALARPKNRAQLRRLAELATELREVAPDPPLAAALLAALERDGTSLGREPAANTLQRPALEAIRPAERDGAGPSAAAAHAPEAATRLERAAREPDATPLDDTSLALLTAVSATHAPEALSPVLERLFQVSEDEPADFAADGGGLGVVLAALADYAAASPADGRAADPLLARLARSARPRNQAKLIALLGWSGAARAGPALEAALQSPSPAVQRASLLALGQIGARAGLPAVRPFLSARRSELRLAAARAYAQLMQEAELVELLSWLDSARAADRAALLTSIGLGLGRLRAAQALTAGTERRALDSLSRWVEAPDPQLSAHALDALRRFGHPTGARAIARELLSPKPPRRAAAAFALAQFRGDETRGLLRFVLQHNAPQASQAAVLALGELGDQRDVAALIRLAAHGRWPLPAAATFALHRIALRDAELKKRALERALCELGELNDPYARANLAATLAALGGGGCPNIELAEWYAAGQPSVVRAAAGRWLRARTRAETQPEPRALQLLAECSVDPDPLVRAACAAGPAAASGSPSPTNAAPAAATNPSPVVGQVPSPPKPIDELDLSAYAADGETRLRDRLVAIRFSDASTFVGYTDANARLLLADVPPGPVTLEDPGE